ncbi:hypothetical protein ACFQS3_16650 [Glycomyces mayteni]|uniref:Uncharacterized protein n=1 Tax=Glycomyces mayteni TaxID=543887 RepID=A0ABW2DCK4_9ACTN|nr:hypothetical protein GCM10025732_19440 [Glycomyces mayteni]
MTDDWDAAADDADFGADFGTAGGADAGAAAGGFGDDFFADLESAPGTDTGAEDLFAADGPDEYFYEAEGDGTFETAAADSPDTPDAPGPDDFTDADFPFDLDFDVGGEG